MQSFLNVNATKFSPLGFFYMAITMEKTLLMVKWKAGFIF
jgi:hypothetical protein